MSQYAALFAMYGGLDPSGNPGGWDDILDLIADDATVTNDGDGEISNQANDDDGGRQRKSRNRFVDKLKERQNPYFPSGLLDGIVKGLASGLDNFSKSSDCKKWFRETLLAVADCACNDIPSPDNCYNDLAFTKPSNAAAHVALTFRKFAQDVKRNCVKECCDKKKGGGE